MVPYFERKPYLEMLESPSAPMPPQGDAGSVSDLARGVLAEETATTASPDGPFRVKGAVAPGGSGNLIIGITGPATGSIPSLELIPSALRGPAGSGMIPASHVSATPSPVRVAPGVETDVSVTIRVPATAAPGVYRGRLDAGAGVPLAMIIEIDVSPKAG